MALLTEGDSSAKIAKSNLADKGYYSSIMYLAPYKLSGYNLCSSASPGCISGCLNISGRGRMSNVQQARLKRTKYFFEDRTNFIRDLYAEIRKFVAKCRKLGLKPALRLNGTSDIMWEQVLPQLFVDFPEIQFYDYTKIYKRMLRYINGELPANYHLTFSLSEVNFDESLDIVNRGGSVAVVFRHKNLPSQWLGIKVHNADSDDLRFLDMPGWQGLYAKGKMKRDTTNFVVEN